MSRLGWWLGGTLAVAGALVLIGYAAYYFTRGFFGSSGVPIAVQVAVPAMVFGALVLLLAALKELLAEVVESKGPDLRLRALLPRPRDNRPGSGGKNARFATPIDGANLIAEYDKVVSF
jgi:hypothetical protein